MFLVEWSALALAFFGFLMAVAVESRFQSFQPAPRTTKPAALLVRAPAE
jgi:hypothetical protein